MSKKYWYDILVSAWVNVELMGESMCLVCIQLQEQNFEKKYLTKVMEISNNYYATISFRGMCTVQNISTTFQYFDVFLYVGDIFLHFWSWVWFWFRQLCSERKLTVSFNIENLTLFNPSWTKQLMKKKYCLSNF